MAEIQSITSQANGFVVVSLWKPEGQPLAKGGYEYERLAELVRMLLPLAHRPVAGKRQTP